MAEKIKKQRNVPSIEELNHFSRVHLRYEIIMFFEVAKLLKKAKQGTPEFSALLESFIIHATILIEFFYNKSKHDDTARAFDYITQRGQWLQSIPPYQHSYELRSRRHKEMAHLSYARLNVDPSERSWKVSEVVDDMRSIIDQFLMQADPERLHEDIYQLKGLL